MVDRIQTDVVILGAGPGGYTAAFAAAERGLKVILVEEGKRPGGVCLNRGCIPSKALLHVAHIIKEARESEHRGVRFEKPEINLHTLHDWKESILNKLSSGIRGLAKGKGVQMLEGRGYFEDSQTLRVETTDGQNYISFKKAIVAVGSKPILPKAFDLGNPRIMTSDQALELVDVPKDFLIVGGGYIGMELGTVYAALGSRVVLVEALQSILSGGADMDLVAPVAKKAQAAFKEIRTGVKVLKMATVGKKIKVTFEAKPKNIEELYDKVFVAIGRAPNSAGIGLENTKAEKDAKGFIKINNRQETSDPNILAIGDVAGGVLLAHKAAKEAKVAVDAILGGGRTFENIIIPAVVFTDPEIAWCGLTETEARAKSIPVKVAKFPWSASGRALTLDHPEGLTKLIIDPETDRVLGVGICGYGAGEMISEGVLAIEMGATAQDLAEIVHPHPTLPETMMECAEKFYVPH